MKDIDILIMIIKYLNANSNDPTVVMNTKRALDYYYSNVSNVGIGGIGEPVTIVSGILAVLASTAPLVQKLFMQETGTPLMVPVLRPVEGAKEQTITATIKNVTPIIIVGSILMIGLAYLVLKK